MSKRSLQELEALVSSTAHGVAEFLKERFGKEIGFALHVFEFDGAFATYASNAEREDMIRHLESFIAQMKAGTVSRPTKPGVT